MQGVFSVTASVLDTVKDAAKHAARDLASDVAGAAADVGELAAQGASFAAARSRAPAPARLDLDPSAPRGGSGAPPAPAPAPAPASGSGGLKAKADRLAALKARIHAQKSRAAQQHADLGTRAPVEPGPEPRGLAPAPAPEAPEAAAAPAYRVVVDASPFADPPAPPPAPPNEPAPPNQPAPPASREAEGLRRELESQAAFHANAAALERAKLVALEEAADGLQARLQEAEAAASSATAAAAEAAGRAERLEQQAAAERGQWQGAVQRLEGKYAELEREYRRVSEQRSDRAHQQHLEAEARGLQQEAARAREEAERARGEREAAEREWGQRLRQQAEEAEARVAALQEQLKAAMLAGPPAAGPSGGGEAAEVGDLRARLDGAREDLRGEQAARRKAEEKAQKAVQRLLDREMEEEEKDTFVASLEDQLAELKAVVRTLEGELQREQQQGAGEELDRKQRELEQVQRDMQGVHSKLAAKETELQRLQLALGSFAADNDMMQEKEAELLEALKQGDILRYELDQARKAAAEGAATLAASEAEVQRAVDVQDRLRIEVSNARGDMIRTQKALESALLQLKSSKQDDTALIDRRVVVKLLLTYFERGQAPEVLAVMAGMLGLTEEERQRVGVKGGKRKGLLRSVLGAPVAIVKGGLSLADKAIPTPNSTADPNFSDKWLDFLLEEEAAEGGGTAPAANGGPAPGQPLQLDFSQPVSAGPAPPPMAMGFTQATSGPFDSV